MWSKGSTPLPLQRMASKAGELSNAALFELVNTPRRNANSNLGQADVAHLGGEQPLPVAIAIGGALIRAPLWMS